jgi:hypothetical protein
MADITKAPSWSRVLDAMAALKRAKTTYDKKLANDARKAAIAQCQQEVAEVEEASVEVSASPKPPEPVLAAAPSPSAPLKPVPPKPEVKEITADDLLPDADK